MNCLLCYKALDKGEVDYHPRCVKTIFGLKEIPVMDIDEKELVGYAKKLIEANIAVTGVQPKLSLWLESSRKDVRFTIVNEKSNYIIKPQSTDYTCLPENEDLCMHLSHELGIHTAIHGLVRTKSGNLAYITRRFDREGEKKWACEDLCQLTETLTEHKYRGSHEKVGKTIRQYSTQAGLDALEYFDWVLLGFITGNADMHLKNFSMLEGPDGSFTVSPAYDLVSTFLVIKNEPEQMSLTINGKKNKITKKDFDVLASSLGLTDKQAENRYNHFLKKIPAMEWWIENSFLPDGQKEKLIQLVNARMELFRL